MTVESRGNQRHYQANPASPIFAELCSIVDKTVGLAGPIREALAALAEDIQAAFVYGSMARKTEDAGSDIDLMVISDRLTYADLFGALEPATRRLGRTVNPTVYPQGELHRRMTEGNAFVKRVMAQPRLWIIGSEGAV